LDVGENYLSAEGIQYLTSGLKGCASLASLNLQNNEIHGGNGEIASFIRSLPPSLTELNMSNNKALGVEGGRALR
ncbi:unnamed protein product, partial [Chrysoparadoxa australica]